ncbi:MAG: hypothetical protein AAGG02_10280 [Cyanobacteria bacterium P01_H01_bin.15]
MADLDKDKFFYPKSTYHGNFSPENLVFNANLQEFAGRINIICGLETAGKITSAEAYRRIKDLWQSLDKSKEQLGIDEAPDT